MSESSRSRDLPLAERLRPHNLEEIIGQDAAVKLMEAYVKQGQMPSVVFFGPPGTGKTTFSRLLSRLLEWEGEHINATSASVKEIREKAAQAKDVEKHTGNRTVLFVDEIHRLNKGRQDVLLPFVEDGVFVLAGSTTENPFFALNQALRSRVQLIGLEPLTPELILGALQRGAQLLDVEADEEALVWVSRRVSGDLRIAYTTLESATALARADGTPVRQAHVGLCLKQTILAGDRQGDNHYDLASAFQKSLRGSDADAAVYYLARFLESGEDPLFVARRLLVTASEDVGNADPQAFVIASHAFRAVEILGLPEARIPLTQAAIYVARAPKSKETIAAIDAARDLIRGRPADPIPGHLRKVPLPVGNGDALGGRQKSQGRKAPTGSHFLPQEIQDQRFCDSIPAPSQVRMSESDVEAFHQMLRGVHTQDSWFSVDAKNLAERFDCPVERVKTLLNQLVQLGHLRFKRSFKWPTQDGKID